MKIFVNTAICLVFVSLLLFTNRNAESAETTPISKILHDKSIQGLINWETTDNSFLVVAKSYVKTFANTKLTNRKLIIYKKHNSGFTKIYEYDAALDHFVAMFPLGDNSNNLMTIWTAGSSYHFNIYTLTDGIIYLTLQEGSHNFPEIVDVDNDGGQEILISEGAFLRDKETGKIISRPVSTRIFKWNGKSYTFVKTAPWETRLNAFNNETR